ncbi:MAG: Hpt domain-containing protein [Desulfobacterales bacterium]|nr:Hpt domain-containing protein [Desulfobacterales bacterium]
MDLKELASNLGLEDDEFYELVELFISTAGADLEKLENAYNNREAKDASRAAHSLKGSSANLGFIDLSAIAKKAEELAMNKDLETIGSLVGKLKEKLAVIEKKLEESGYKS